MFPSIAIMLRWKLIAHMVKDSVRFHTPMGMDYHHDRQAPIVIPGTGTVPTRHKLLSMSLGQLYFVLLSGLGSRGVFFSISMTIV
jgi:hypothetical protein